MNEAQVFVAGYVAREPRFRKTHNGYSYTSLRVGYTPRRMDRDSGEWSDTSTSFVTVFCWRGLADNVATCVRKGDPVLIKGKLQVRPYKDKDGAARVAVEVEASSIGHDLARGVANFQRAHRAAGETALERAANAVPSGGPEGNGTGPGGPEGDGTWPGGPEGNGTWPGGPEGNGTGPGGPAAGLAGTPAGPGAEMFAEEAVAELAAAQAGDTAEAAEAAEADDLDDGAEQAAEAADAGEAAEPEAGAETVGAATPF